MVWDGVIDAGSIHKTPLMCSLALCIFASLKGNYSLLSQLHNHLFQLSSLCSDSFVAFLDETLTSFRHEDTCLRNRRKEKNENYQLDIEPAWIDSQWTNINNDCKLLEIIITRRAGISLIEWGRHTKVSTTSPIMLTSLKRQLLHTIPCLFCN